MLITIAVAAAARDDWLLTALSFIYPNVKNASFFKRANTQDTYSCSRLHQSLKGLINVTFIWAHLVMCQILLYISPLVLLLVIICDTVSDCYLRRPPLPRLS